MVGALRCEHCGSTLADVHTGLCPSCMCRLAPYDRWLYERDAITSALLRNALVENPVAVRWTEQQYQEHMRRMHEPQQREERKARKPGKPKVPDALVFELELTPSHNEFLRMHYRARRRLMDRIAGQISQQIPLASGIPFRAAKVEIVRRSSVKPDADALHGACKPILDAMQVRSKRHPYGACVIEDDSTDHIELVPRWEKAPPKHGSVVIIVTQRA